MNRPDSSLHPYVTSDRASFLAQGSPFPTRHSAAACETAAGDLRTGTPHSLAG